MDVTVHVGMMKKITVQGRGAQGELEPLDQATPLVLEVLSGASRALQASSSPFDFWITGEDAIGEKSSFKVTADGHVGPGEAFISGQIDSTTIPQDAVAAGFVEGEEVPIGSAL